MDPLPSDDHYVGLFFFVWGSDARSTHTLERLRAVLQAKTDDRDGLFFDWFAYFKSNYRRIQLFHLCVHDDVIMDITPE